MLARFFVLSVALAIVLAASAVVRATSPPKVAPVPAKLFDNTDYVSLEQALTQINEHEAAILRKARDAPQYKSVQVTRINRAALAQSVITLQTTDGVRRQYVQQRHDPSLTPKMKHWHGTSKRGIVTFAYTDDGQFAGRLVDYGKHFRFNTLRDSGLTIMTEMDTTKVHFRDTQIHE